MGAPAGLQSLALSVRYELFNGKLGGPFGVFTDHLTFDVNVVADKPRQMSGIKSRRGGQASMATGVAANGTVVGKAVADPAMSGSANQMSDSPQVNVDGAGDPAPSVTVSPTLWTVYGAGAALLIAIVLLLSRRR